MSSSVGPFAYYTEFRVHPGSENAWWTDGLIEEVVLDPVRRDGDLARATHVSYDSADGVPIDSVDELFEIAKTWRTNDYSVVAIYAGDFDNPAWKLHLVFGTSGPEISAEIAEDRDGAFRERFRAWVGEWSRGFERVGCDLSVGSMLPVGCPYPRPRPPREGRRWPLGKLDVYLGRRWHAAEAERQQVFERITTTVLPAGVRRESVGDDVVSLAFDCDLLDGESVSRARELSERWLTPLVPTSPERGWNEYGDKLVVPMRPVDREPFTFYDERNEVGYWALAPDPDDGSVDEARWEQLSTIARKRSLDDGTPVAAVRLVAPVRQVAVALLPRAAAAGFEMVTYPQGNGGFWHVISEDERPA